MNSTKNNYLFNLLLTIVNLLFPILSFPYAARILGPVGIGKVQFITSFAQYFSLVAALGIPIYGIREIAKVQKDRTQLNRTFSELLVIYFISSILLSLTYFVVIVTINRFHENLPSYYASAGIILLGFCSVDWFYAGIEQFKTIALRSLFIKIISLVFLYAFVKTSNDIFIYLLITLFALIGNNVVSLMLVWKNVSIVTKNLNFKRHYKPLFFIFSTSIASSMYTLLDVVILGFLSNDKSVGYYSAGVKLAKMTIPFVTSLGAVVMPKISYYLSKKNFDEFYNILNKSFEFIVFISIPITIGLFLLSSEAIVLFSGNKFLPAQGVMEILSLMPVVIGLGYFFGIQILIAGGKDRQMFISVSVGMIVSIGLNFLLIPIFNENGAAYANIISEIFVTLTYIYFVNKSYSFKINYYSFLKATTASLLFIPVVIFSRMLFTNIFIEVMIAMLTCTIIYFTIQFYMFKNQIALLIYNMIINRFKKFQL